MERRNLKMDNDNVLDMRHLIRVADDDKLFDDENQKKGEDWNDYSESTTSLESAMEENYLTGQQKRRLRRLKERKLKKLKIK